MEVESHLEAVRLMSAPPRGDREGMFDTPSPPSVLMNCCWDMVLVCSWRRMLVLSNSGFWKRKHEVSWGHEGSTGSIEFKGTARFN